MIDYVCDCLLIYRKDICAGCVIDDGVEAQRKDGGPRRMCAHTTTGTATSVGN